MDLHFFFFFVKIVFYIILKLYVIDTDGSMKSSKLSQFYNVGFVILADIELFIVFNYMGICMCDIGVSDSCS